MLYLIIVKCVGSFIDEILCLRSYVMLRQSRATCRINIAPCDNDPNPFATKYIGFSKPQLKVQQKRFHHDPQMFPCQLHRINIRICCREHIADVIDTKCHVRSFSGTSNPSASFWAHHPQCVACLKTAIGVIGLFGFCGDDCVSGPVLTG